MTSKQVSILELATLLQNEATLVGVRRFGRDTGDGVRCRSRDTPDDAECAST